MVFRVWCLFPPLVLVLFQPGTDGKAQDDLKAMQGTWEMHALEINGKVVPPAQFQGTLLIVKGDEYRTQVKGKLLTGFRMKLDPSKRPAWMDMIQSVPGQADATIKAIYKLETDTLTLARGLAPDQERPNQFATWPDTNYFVVTWKRQGK